MTPGGKVYLVGAGPGAPDLITLRAVRILERADVVLYDYLVHPNLLYHCPETAERICVGKKKGHHSKTQQDINQLMAAFAAEGKKVVRLKGGDPCIFGRGGEEMEFLKTRGVAYEIVPGVTSAIAVPSYAGIPLTHRDLSRSVAFVTGTLKRGKSAENIPIPEADTLVFLMALTHLQPLVKRLKTFRHFSGSTPVALIYKGTWAEQKTIPGTLDTIAAIQETHRLGTPALLVVGNVAGLADQLGWVHTLPLFGKRVIILRAVHQAQPLITELSLLGAEAIALPLLSFEPNERAQKRVTPNFLKKFTVLIFTSANGVDAFFNALFTKGDARTLTGKRIVAIGPKTAEALKSYGIRADAMPPVYDAAAITKLFKKTLKQETVLIPTAEGARQALPAALRSRGAKVTVLRMYKTLCPPLREIPLSGGDYVVFTSPSTVTHFFKSGIYNGQDIVPFCIGRVTADEAKKYLAGPLTIAADSTAESLINAILNNANGDSKG